jgi:cellobiose phosphorylase
MKNKFREDINFTLSNSFSHSNIGYWSIDDVNLPTFNYTGKIPYQVTASDGVKITYPEDPWFLIGNYVITGFVHTSGAYDLYTLRRAWGRLNVATEKNPTNLATIRIDEKEYYLSGLDSPVACNAKKEFGTGFANFNMKIDNEIQCERIIATAPSQKINSGEAALLITVKLTNTGNETKKVHYTESILANYQMVDEKRISYRAIPKVNENYISVSFEPHTDKTITKPSKEEASTYDFYPPELFIKGKGEVIYDAVDNQDNTSTIFAKYEFQLKSSECKTLRFVVGFKYGNENIDDISNTLFSEGKEDAKFRSLWKKILPDYSYQKDEVVKREQYWNTYVLEASAKYNDYFEETFIPQGMTYDYIWGLNAVARDHLHYSLPANYFNPELSKSIIRFVLKEMNPNGFFHYNVNGYGYAVPNLWNPSDLQLHVFWAIAEYLEKTNDYSFLKEETAYYPKRINYKASVLEKLRVAFDYLNDEIGVGSHGLVKMLNADWNDQIWNEQPITIYYPTAESHYNASMAIVVLQQLVDELKKASNDPQLTNEKSAIDTLIEKVGLYRERQLKAYIKDLGNRDFAKRAYYNEILSMGDERMHIESQLYTLMIDEIPLEQRQRIVKEVTKRLSNNEVLGVRTTETKVSDTFEAGTHENGGIWQYVQGMYALGLLHVDIKEADKAIERMSFANFAKNYPDYWPGQWTGGDCVNSNLAKHPGLVSNSGSMYMDFPTYCAHIHSWPLLYQFKKKE